MYVSQAASQCHEPLGPPVPPVFPGSPLPSRRPSALCPRLSPQSRGQRLVCIRSGAEGWGSGSPHTTLSARCGQGERRGKNIEVCHDARCSAGRRGCPEPGRLTLPAVRKARRKGQELLSETLPALLSPSPSTVEGVLAAAASARGPFHTQECVELCPTSRRNWN